jgi:hypothetical protein
MNHFLINELLLMAYSLKQLSVGSVFFVYPFGSGCTNDYKNNLVLLISCDTKAVCAMVIHMSHIRKNSFFSYKRTKIRQNAEKSLAG